MSHLGIGAVGASFVITQSHTSVMFGPKVVGTANAAAAGWGNSGGGAAQALMPLLLVPAVIGSIGYAEFLRRRKPAVYAGLSDDLEALNVVSAEKGKDPVPGL